MREIWFRQNNGEGYFVFIPYDPLFCFLMQSFMKNYSTTLMRVHALMYIARNLTSNAVDRNGGHCEPTVVSKDKLTETVVVSHIGIRHFGMDGKSCVSLPWLAICYWEI